jgi:hypothetical protein
MENVVIFYNCLEHFTAIWYNLWPFGIVCCHLVFFRFGIWQPCFEADPPSKNESKSSYSNRNYCLTFSRR